MIIKQRRLPPTAREDQSRERPDTIRLRTVTTNWGETRYVVEALARGRLLGDKPFSDRADALEFARIVAGWDRARMIDATGGGPVSSADQAETGAEPKTARPQLTGRGRDRGKA